jgi:hypothetical protein
MFANPDRDLFVLFQEGFHDLALAEVRALRKAGRAIVRFLERYSGPAVPPII